MGHLIDGAHGADGRTLVQFDLFKRSKSGEIVFVTKSEFDGGNFFGIAMGEVGNIAFADVRAIAIRLAEIDGFIGLAVGGGPGSAGNIHVHKIYDITDKSKIKHQQ